MVLNLLLGVILLFLMVLASGVVVDAIEKLAFKLPIRRQSFMVMFLGFSLALPELFIGIAAALNGKSQIALGSVIGANMANLSLVIGGAAIVSKAIPVVGEYLKRDLWIALGLAILPLWMLGNGVISRIEGLVLLVLYFIYALFVSREKIVSKQVKSKVSVSKKWLWVVILLLGILIVASSAWILVQLTIRVAAIWGVSYFWMGLMLIAFGTTLPELLMAFQRKKKASLILPSLFGSVVMNSTLIIGIVALIQPVILRESLQRGLSGVFLIAILGLFWLFTKSKHKLERWEGVVLIGVYLMFIGLQFIFA